MNRKTYWIIGIGFTLCISAFLFAMINSYRENRDLQKELVELQNKVNSQSDNRQPPPGKTFENGGHWHGDEWHDDPHTESADEYNPLFVSREPIIDDTDLNINIDIEFPTQSDIEQMDFEILNPLFELLVKKSRNASEAGDMESAVKYTNASTLVVAEISKRQDDAWSQLYKDLELPKPEGTQGHPKTETVYHIQLNEDGTVDHFKSEVLPIDDPTDKE